MSAAVNGDLPQRANKVARCRKSFTAAGVSVAAGHRITMTGKNSARHGGQLCNAAQVHFYSSVSMARITLVPQAPLQLRLAMTHLS